MKWHELYKGYVPLNGKAAMIKFKDVPLMSYEDAEKYQDANGVGGVLADNAVLIDIDDDFQFNKALTIVKEKQYPVIARKTSRGGHITALNNKSFTKCGTKIKLACGLTVDIKIGNNQYQALKVDSTNRQIVYEANEIGELPKIFTPISTTTDFISLGDGDGRNSALYSYILTLTSAGFSKEEIKEAITVINYYILRAPLPENELDIILREDAFPNMSTVFFENKKFLHNRLGDYLIGKMNICLIDGRIHSYVNGFYVPGTKAIESEIVTMIPTLKDAQIKETLSYIKRCCKEIEPAPPKYIGFANGVLDIETDIMQDFSPDIVITNKIPWNYNPTAESTIVNDCLNQWTCGDSDIRFLLEEMAGYCLYRKNILQKMFILTGEKANGKSTFLDLITWSIGAGNCSALDLSSVGKRFGTAVLAGKLVNIGDDISDEFLDGYDIATIKKIVTGDRLTAEFKGRDLFEFSPYAKMIFSANNIPRMKDGTDAMLRRLVIIPFNAKFNNKYDSRLREKLQTKEAAETMLKYAVEGLKRCLKREKFIDSVLVQAELNDFEVSNDPIKSFLSTYLQDGDELLRNPVYEIYKEYKIYCVENGYKSVNQNLFGRYVKRKYTLETYTKRIESKVISMYRKSCN